MSVAGEQRMERVDADIGMEGQEGVMADMGMEGMEAGRRIEEELRGKLFSQFKHGLNSQGK